MRIDPLTHRRRQSCRLFHLGAAPAVALLAVLVAAPDAGAQDALGSGDLLDANLSKQGPRNATRRIEDFRRRNLVVTGNVAAGRGFRGEVGYGAERDFRGATGSDELFNFRADSVLSSMSYVRGRQTLNTLDLGQQTALFSIDRADSGTTLSTLNDPSRLRLEGPRVDRLNLIDRAAELASSRSFIEIAGEPNLVSEAVDRDGSVMYTTSSPLRGLQLGSTETFASVRGVTAYDLAVLREALENRVEVTPPGTPFAPSFVDLDPTARPPSLGDLTAGDRQDPGQAQAAAEAARVDTRVRASQEPDYASIMQRIADRYSDRDDVNLSVQEALLNQLDQEFGSLRAALLDATARTPRDETPDLNAPGVTPADEPEEGEGPVRRPDRGPEIAPPTTVRPIEDYGILLRHGQVVERLSATTDTRFGQLVTEAQQRMAEGEYFRAERLFNRALRFTPNHPFAQVGLAHAQIGAGFYLSSSLTLQQVFALFPEMIDVQYAPDLLPLPLRMQEAVEQLRTRIGQREARDKLGFLLAYLGRQQNDRAMIAEGLQAMRRGVTDATFVDLLEGVWLPDGAAADGEK